MFQYYRPFVFHLYSSDFLRLLHFFLILVPFSLYNIKFSNTVFLSNFLFIASTSSSSTLSSLCIFFRLSSLLYGFFSYFYTFSSSFMLPEFQLLCSSSIFFLLSSLVYVDVFLTSTRFPLPSCCQNLIFFCSFSNHCLAEFLDRHRFRYSHFLVIQSTACFISIFYIYSFMFLFSSHFSSVVLRTRLCLLLQFMIFPFSPPSSSPVTNILLYSSIKRDNQFSLVLDFSSLPPTSMAAPPPLT